MKYLLLFIVLLFSAESTAISPAQRPQQVLLESGLLTMFAQKLIADTTSADSLTQVWAKGFYKRLYREFYSYKPKKKYCRQLQSLWQGVQIRVIGGNWCSDTRREVPRLLKVLDESGFPSRAFEYYRVNREKKPADSGFVCEVTIQSVPAIYVLRNGKTVGKIEETPKRTLESDLLKILRTSL